MDIHVLKTGGKIECAFRDIVLVTRQNLPK